MSDIFSIIKSRRSVRIFKDQSVSKDIIEKIIEAGNWAPSHCNTQAWRFVVINDKKIKQEIVDQGGSPVIKNAPYCLLVNYNLNSSDNEQYQDWIQSSSAAMQNMLLVAHSLGLGACWICHLPNKNNLRKIMSIPKNYDPVGCIVFGHPQKESLLVKRKNNIRDIYSFNRFIWSAEKKSAKTSFKKNVKGAYFVLPKPVKKVLAPITDKLTKKFKN